MTDQAGFLSFTSNGLPSGGRPCRLCRPSGEPTILLGAVLVVTLSTGESSVERAEDGIILPGSQVAAVGSTEASMQYY